MPRVQSSPSIAAKRVSYSAGAVGTLSRSEPSARACPAISSPATPWKRTLPSALAMLTRRTGR